jgi:hypothetical protein
MEESKEIVRRRSAYFGRTAKPSQIASLSNDEMPIILSLFNVRPLFYNDSSSFSITLAAYTENMQQGM